VVEQLIVLQGEVELVLVGVPDDADTGAAIQLRKVERGAKGSGQLRTRRKPEECVVEPSVEWRLREDFSHAVGAEARAAVCLEDDLDATRLLCLASTPLD